MPISKRMDKEGMFCVYKGLLLCFAMLSCLSPVQLSVTSWTVAHQAPLSMGLSRQEQWNGIGWVGLPYPPPEDLFDPGIEPTSYMSPALAGRFFTTNATWKAHSRLLKVK